MSDFEEQMEDLVYVFFFCFPFSTCRWSSWLTANSEEGRFTKMDQELIIRSNETPIEPPDDLLLTHKTLMALLLQYEHLTKRISSIQCEEGGNQATVQGAVARMAATFLTKEMLKVQVCLLFVFVLLDLLFSPSPYHLPVHSFLFASLWYSSYLGTLISGTASVPETPG
jgi:hypothetical protein